MSPGTRVNVLGLTFKEDCPDIRNTKVVDIVAELKAYGMEVAVHDPLADARDAHEHYGLELTRWEDLKPAQATIVAVAHKEFIEAGADRIVSTVVPGGCIIDVKSVLDRKAIAASGRSLWRL
jgi:UDP-N-acetyl-D-galactosamine dehydrogenase